MEVRRLDPTAGGLADVLKGIETRVSQQETRAAGNIVIRQTLTTTDPTTGVSAVFGQLPDGRIGFQQFLGDTTPPPVPVAPTATSALGTATVIWSGSFSASATAPADFNHCNVYGQKSGTTSTVLGGSVANPNDAAIFTGLVGGDTWTFWLTSVDQNGNESAASLSTPPVVIASVLDDTGLAQKLQDNTNAINDANNAIKLKSSVLSASAAPSGSHNVNDLWFNTSQGNKPYRWDGAAWVDSEDQAVISAQSTAISAQNIAVSANNTAVSAQNTANSVNSVAVSANNTAVAAQNTAVSAQNAAASAQATANSVNGTAVSAQNAAASAQSTANTAQSVAASANSLANTANNAANNAQVIANGKNSIFLTSTAPVASADGDQWVDLGNGRVIKSWSASSSAWVPSIQPGAITATQIAADTITAGNIAAGAITASELAANSVSASALAANSITATALAAQSITATALAAQSITATALAAQSITATALAAQSITATALAAGSITASALAAGAITATALQAGAVTASSIAAGAVTANALAAGSITATALAAQSITATALAAQSITASALKAGSITASALAAGSITASALAAQSITATAMAANSISATALQAGSVVASTIGAQAVQASAIAANTITANQIAASTITGDRISASTITSTQIAASTIQAYNIAASAIRGDHISGGAIDGKTITGATVQTAVSGARITLNNAGLNGWDASGNNYLKADSNGLQVLGKLSASGVGWMTDHRIGLQAVIGPNAAIGVRKGIQSDQGYLPGFGPPDAYPGIGFLADGQTMSQTAGMGSSDGFNLVISAGNNYSTNYTPPQISLDNNGMTVNSGTGNIALNTNTANGVVNINSALSLGGVLTSGYDIITTGGVVKSTYANATALRVPTGYINKFGLTTSGSFGTTMSTLLSGSVNLRGGSIIRVICHVHAYANLNNTYAGYTMSINGTGFISYTKPYALSGYGDTTVFVGTYQPPSTGAYTLSLQGQVVVQNTTVGWGTGTTANPSIFMLVEDIGV